jgi:RNA polymerase sigma-70 factor (ECF subfamily)
LNINRPRNVHGAAGVLETYRAYLLLIANRELSPELRTLVGASDLVQESLIEAQQSLADFAGESEAQFLAWLRRILLNNLADAARKHGQALSLTVRLDDPLGENSSAAGIGDCLAIDQPSPLHDLVVAEQWSGLMAALDRLPEELGHVIRLRNFELLTFEEIGKRLGRSAGTVCRTWYKAIERLQRELGEG